MDIFNCWLVNKYIAHRGLYNEQFPENSLSAFQNAIDHDYAIEIDIHKIEDSTPVAFHDETLFRLTGQDGYVKKIQDEKELKKYKLLDTQEKIPTLKEVLKFVNGRTPILIEIKDFDTNSTFEKRIYEELKDYKGEFAIMSFNPYTLKWFRLNAPEILRGQLACNLKNQKISLFKKLLLKRMALNKNISQPHFIAYKWDEVPNRFVKRFKHLPLLVWPVPSQQAYMKVAKHCDNIIFENFNPRI